MDGTEVVTSTQCRPWEPDERLVDYTHALLGAMGYLWEDSTKTVVANITELKLNAAWQTIWRDFPVVRQELCCEVFWNRVTCRFPDRSIYRVDAMWGGTLNQDGDAKRVLLHVRPANCCEIVQLNLRYRT